MNLPMRGLDTNVLIRLIAGDDQPQSVIAREAIDAAERDGRTLFVSLPVLCELLWTLSRSYGLDRAQLAAVVDGLLDAPVFAIQDRDIVRLALVDFKRDSGGFVDYLLGHLGRAHGCVSTWTFDRSLLDHPLFDRPEAPQP